MKKSSAIAAVLALSAVSQTASAQIPPSSQTPHQLRPVAASELNDVHIDWSKLDAAADLLDQATTPTATNPDPKMRGAVLLVVRHGRVVMHETFGKRDGLQPGEVFSSANPNRWWLDPDANAPMPLDGIFDLQSMTKPLVAFIAMRAHEVSIADGSNHFSLNDLVTKWLPEFDDADPSKSTVTVGDLMRYSSGLFVDVDESTSLLRTDPHPWDRIVAEPLLFTPSQQAPVVYSDLGYRVLGHVLEHALGQDLDTLFGMYAGVYIQMWDTHWIPELTMDVPGKRERLVGTGYSNHSGNVRSYYLRGQVQDDNDWHIETTGFARTGCDGAFSTAWDYAKFVQVLMNRGVHVYDYDTNGAPIVEPLLSPAGVQAMISVQSSSGMASPSTTFTENLLWTDKGYGWEKPDGGKWPGGSHFVASSFSKTGGAGTLVVAHPDPALDYFFILLTNHGLPKVDDPNVGVALSSSPDPNLYPFGLAWPAFDDMLANIEAEQVSNLIAEAMLDANGNPVW